jgi:hypothetical protein
MRALKILMAFSISVMAIQATAQESTRIEAIRKLYYKTMEFQEQGIVDSTEFAEKNSRLPNGQTVALQTTFYTYPEELWRVKVFWTGEDNYTELSYFFLGKDNYFVFENTAVETCVAHYRHYFDEYHRRIRLLAQDNNCDPMQGLSKNLDITNRPEQMLLESNVDAWIEYAKTLMKK